MVERIIWLQEHFLLEFAVEYAFDALNRYLTALRSFA